MSSLNRDEWKWVGLCVLGYSGFAVAVWLFCQDVRKGPFWVAQRERLSKIDAAGLQFRIPNPW